MSKQNAQSFLIIGALLGLTGVLLGAFGAHALKEILVLNARLEVWKTAVAYQMWHALLILFIGQTWQASRLRTVALASLSIGVLLFSGSLYWIALDAPRWVGPLTPVGGLILIMGWSFIIVVALREKRFPRR